VLDGRAVLTVGGDALSLPASDCAVLDLANTTTEALASLIAGRVAAMTETRSAGKCAGSPSFLRNSRLLAIRASLSQRSAHGLPDRSQLFHEPGELLARDRLVPPRGYARLPVVDR